MTYSEKLKDPRWQKKRLQILERDKWTCRACGEDGKTLNVHHIFYLPRTEPWETPDGFLITFCEDCHKGGPCNEQYGSCEKCPEYGTDPNQCMGVNDHAKEITAQIATLLNFIFSNQDRFADDYNDSIGYAHFTLKKVLRIER